MKYPLGKRHIHHYPCHAVSGNFTQKLRLYRIRNCGLSSRDTQIRKTENCSTALPFAAVWRSLSSNADQQREKEAIRVIEPFRRGKAASWSSILTPFRDSTAGGISSMCKITGWSGPSMIPRAIIGTRAYPICPAVQ